MVPLPTLQSDSVILIRARKDSGIILNNDNNAYLQCGNDYYRIFSSLEDARGFIREEKQMDDSFEYLIFDHNHSCIEMHL